MEQNVIEEVKDTEVIAPPTSNTAAVCINSTILMFPMPSHCSSIDATD